MEEGKKSPSLFELLFFSLLFLLLLLLMFSFSQSFGQPVNCLFIRSFDIQAPETLHGQRVAPRRHGHEDAARLQDGAPGELGHILLLLLGLVGRLGGGGRGGRVGGAGVQLAQLVVVEAGNVDEVKRVGAIESAQREGIYR
jgi:hypothetical protein